MSDTVLIIDQGSHSTRALVFDGNGNVKGSSSVSVDTVFPASGFIEQNPETVLSSVFAAIDALVSDITAISKAALIVQRSSLLACRKDSLKPLTNIISWQDTRNRECIMALHDYHDNMNAITGLRPNAHYGASKMRWLLDNDQAVQQAAKEHNLLFVPLAAWLASRITASLVCRVDPVIASRTLLMSLEQVEWNAQLLSWFGIDTTMLPEIVDSESNFGSLDIKGHPVPLTLVGGDQSFIAFAYGKSINPDIAYVNVGTGAFVQMLRPSDQDDKALLSSPLVINQHEKVIVKEGTVNAAATALDWLWGQAGKTLSYDQLEVIMKHCVDVPVFINTIAGIGSPWWLSAQEPVFIGAGSIEQKAVAVIESIVFGLQDNIERLKSINLKLSKIVIGGGLSRSDRFCQKLADLSGLVVVRPKMHEISALGAACYLMPQMEADMGPLNNFEPGNNDELLRRYHRYGKAIQQLM